VAPLGEGVKATTVSNVIRCGYLRSKLAIQATGTHILRRTLATNMLCGGATLKEVADVLRHRCLNTTTLYTKVDVPHLKKVTLPWPRRLS
jgi:integrase/recombinase XerD